MIPPLKYNCFLSFQWMVILAFYEHINICFSKYMLCLIPPLVPHHLTNVNWTVCKCPGGVQVCSTHVYFHRIVEALNPDSLLPFAGQCSRTHLSHNSVICVVTLSDLLLCRRLLML